MSNSGRRGKKKRGEINFNSEKGGGKTHSKQRCGFARRDCERMASNVEKGEIPTKSRGGFLKNMGEKEEKEAF